jgi:hypothetical protein
MFRDKVRQPNFMSEKSGLAVGQLIIPDLEK